MKDISAKQSKQNDHARKKQNKHESVSIWTLASGKLQNILIKISTMQTNYLSPKPMPVDSSKL